MNEFKALSVRQPWAWAIIHGGKDVENRAWPTSYRGEIYIHAPAGLDRLAYSVMLAIQKTFGREGPSVFDLHSNGIIGKVKLIDCVQSSTSKWFSGPYGFVFANPEPIEFIPMKGTLGIFNITF